MCRRRSLTVPTMPWAIAVMLASSSMGGCDRWPWEEPAGEATPAEPGGAATPSESQRPADARTAAPEAGTSDAAEPEPEPEPEPPPPPSPYDAMLEQLAPGEGPGAEAEPPWSEQGRTKLAAGDHDGAMLAFARAARLRPDDWRPVYDLARAAMAGGNADFARIALSRAVWLDPIAVRNGDVYSDFDRERRESWFHPVILGEVSLGLGGRPDWEALGVHMSSVTGRFFFGQWSGRARAWLLQVHFEADVTDEHVESHRVLWTAACEDGGELVTTLNTVRGGFGLQGLDDPIHGTWRGRVAALDLFGSGARPILKAEPERCELSFFLHRSQEHDDASLQLLQRYCWRRDEPKGAELATEGRCPGLTRPAGPAEPFTVTRAEARMGEPSRSNASFVPLEHDYTLRIGSAAGQWLSPKIELRCRCGANECQPRYGSSASELRKWSFRLAEPGETARLHLNDSFELPEGTEPPRCHIRLGLGSKDVPFEVQAEYCFADGSLSPKEDGDCGLGEG